MLFTQNSGLLYNGTSTHLYVELLKSELLGGKFVTLSNINETKTRQAVMDFFGILGNLPVTNWTCLIGALGFQFASSAFL